MRLSTVVELLLILLLVAFAAWARVIDPKSTGKNTTALTLTTNGISLKQATDNVNRYCVCNDVICNCCRDFHIPLVQLKGPGCASLQYLKGDNLAVQLSFGDNILTSTIVNGKNPKPVCVPLLGGFSKFCGRIYSIEREENEHFKACLGLELQSTTELEASLRVSCFRFGPDGLKLRPSEPLPIVEDEIQSEEDDDDDDDDFLGLGTDDDDDDDDDDDEESIPPSPASILNESNPQTNTKDEDDEDDEDEDAFGFQSLIDIFTGDEESPNKKPKPSTSTKPPLLHFTIPMLTRPSDYPLQDNNPDTVNEDELVEKQTPTPITETYTFPTTTASGPSGDGADYIIDDASNKVAQVDRLTNNKLTVLVKKKPTITSTSVNAINYQVKDKKKPTNNDEDDDEDDEDEDEQEEENEEENYEEDDDPDEHNDEDDDDEDEDEDEAEAEVISELVADENGQAKKNNKVKKEEDDDEEDDDDDDYDIDVDDLLARKTQQRIHKP